MNITRLFKSLFISIGLISTIQLGFTPITVEQKNQNYFIESSLEGAITRDIEELLRSATDIGIKFKTTIYSDEKKWTFIDNKKLSYNSLTDEYTLINNDLEWLKTGNNNEAYRAFTTINNQFDKSFRLIVIKAELDIPEINDEAIVASLWGNISPRVSYKFNNDTE